MLQITSHLLVVLTVRSVNAFVQPIHVEGFKRYRYHGATSRFCESALRAKTSLNTASAEEIKDLKSQIENEIKSTKRGLSASPEERTKINSLVQSLESLCPYDEPARMPEMEGKWIVDYTTAPPPSNGKLGPFEGIARQIINLDEGTYINYLSVPGNIEKEFLSARLEATFEEWDGQLLEDDRVTDGTDSDSDDGSDVSTASTDTKAQIFFLNSITSIFQRQPESKESSSPDYGADSWKVDFKTLTIKLFGFKVVEKSFDEGTSRVWKMSYLDEEGTRVVRAGRTGKDEDAMLFYMQKE
mmetsp:Transcript_22051/g.46454  ORF Transcript_22051/g.46454 Transcript_22051/m.46454 type:complete len:299 (-) Transcript_22051:258-1154(-)